MDEQKRIDRILDAIDNRVQEEVGALLGADFVVSTSRRELVGKAEAFEGLQGKQVCALMDITGEVEGSGCLLISVKDAIRLGGTLIMLPESELTEVVGREEYTEEIEDSYGEIANIIAGAYTKDFEEMYPKSCRFIRKEQELLAPLKVDPESDQPVPDQQYYLVASSMMLDGAAMGEMVMLMPAEAFGLAADTGQEEGQKSSGAESSPASSTETVPREGSETGEDGSSSGATEPDTSGAQTTAESQPKKKKSFNLEKHRARVDRLLEACREQLAVEIGGLLGVDVDVIDLENRLLSKEDFFFDEVTGKQVLSNMEVVGDRQGMAYLSISLKDAIHLGGVLIMLPPNELEAVVAEEDFGEDAKDAYGEVANIISGVYTAVFEEQYTEKLRIIRKEMQTVLPGKVEIESDEPVPDRAYYVSSMGLIVDGASLGRLHMLFPAEVLKLEGLGSQALPAEGAAPGSPEATAGDAAPSQATEMEADRSVPVPPQDSAPGIDLEKQRKKIDSLLTLSAARMQEEVAALLGCEVKLTNLENVLISKEEFFFEELSGKQVMADLEVVGDLEGRSTLYVDLKDAIRIGGTLIMLPNSEMEKAIGEDEFGEDTRDAYGEIANIIAGVYTAVFEEEYPQQLRFIRRELELIKPMKVDVESEDPVPDGEYYLSRMDLNLGGEQYGKVRLLVPLELFSLVGLGSQPADEGTEPVAAVAQPAATATSGGAGEAAARPGVVTGSSQPLDVLVIGDDLPEAQKIAESLAAAGYGAKILTFKDDLQGYIPGQLKAVYLVMREVSEQAYGVAIKISSVCRIPLIAAGPAWTRSMVIKAWKYGVRDILVTPAESDDIQESIRNNLLQLAA